MTRTDVEGVSCGLELRAKPRDVRAARAACLREEEHIGGLGSRRADRRGGRRRRHDGRRWRSDRRRRGVEGEPEPFELGSEAGGEAGAAREDEVLVVAARGAAAPIEGAVRLVRGRVSVRGRVRVRVGFWVRVSGQGQGQG